MILLALSTLGLVLLALPGVAARWSSRLPAADWTRVVVVALAAGVTTFLGALLLAAVPAFAWIVDAPSVVDHCRGVLAPLSADPTLLSWGAVAVMSILVVRLASGARRAFTGARRARVESWLGEHREGDGYELVVLPTSEVLAFGVPGDPPQVVVSTGLVDVLEPEQRSAVIAHEVAHHRLRHSRVLAFFASVEHAFGWFTPAGQSVEVGRTAVEAWADDAVGQDSSARRSLRSALSGMTRGTWHADQRLARLRTRMPARAPIARFASFAPVALMLVTVLALVAGWFTDAHHAVALGAPCDH